MDNFAVGDLFSSEGGLDIKLFYSFDLVMMLKRTFSKYWTLIKISMTYVYILGLNLKNETAAITRVTCEAFIGWLYYLYLI